MARPRLPKSRIKNRRYTILVTQGEGDRIERTAKAAGHGAPSDWIRDVVMSQANAVTGVK